MRFKDFVRMLMAAQPHIKSKHGVPITRRQLLGQGLLGFSGTLLLSAGGAVHGRRLLAQEQTTESERTGVVNVDLGGGATLPFNFPPISQNGEPLSAGELHSCGIPAETTGDPTQGALDYSLGVGMNPASHMLAGIKQVASADALAKVNGYITCVANRDDSQANEHNPLHTLAHAGYVGKVVGGVGQDESAGGGKSTVAKDFFDPSRAPVVIRSVNDAIATVLPRTLSEYFDRDAFQAIFRMSQRRSHDRKGHRALPSHGKEPHALHLHRRRHGGSFRRRRDRRCPSYPR